MSIETHVVAAPLSDGSSIADSDSPTHDREGFTFTGFDHIQACTLLSLLDADNPQSELESYLDSITVIHSAAGQWPAVAVISPDNVAKLATIASMDETDFDTLAEAWAETDEFDGWSLTDVLDLLRDLSDLADVASIHNHCIMIWRSP
jgi:hypothetical protein